MARKPGETHTRCPLSFDRHTYSDASRIESDTIRIISDTYLFIRITVGGSR